MAIIGGIAWVCSLLFAFNDLVWSIVISLSRLLLVHIFHWLCVPIQVFFIFTLAFACLLFDRAFLFASWLLIISSFFVWGLFVRIDLLNSFWLDLILFLEGWSAPSRSISSVAHLLIIILFFAIFFEGLCLNTHIVGLFICFNITVIIESSVVTLGLLTLGLRLLAFKLKLAL